MNPQDDFDYRFRVILAGDSGVGKTSSLIGLADTEGKVPAPATLISFGIDCRSAEIKLDGKVIKLDMWDTGGHERFRTITSGYYRGALGVIVMYDVTEQESFSNLKQWLAQIDRYANEDIVRVLVGNKSDLKQRKVETATGQAFADEFDISFLETSAMNRTNIDQLRTMIATEIRDQQVECHGALALSQQSARSGALLQPHDPGESESCGC